MQARFIVHVAFSAALGLLACTTSDSDDTGSSTTTSSTTGSSTSTSSSTTETGTDDPSPTTTGASSSSSSESGDDSSTAATTGGVDDTTGDTSEPAPDMGFEAYCRHYIECGGTYWADEQICLDESYGYWGTCPSRLALLEALATCVEALTCEEFSPNSTPPSNTPCGDYYDELVASDVCD